MVNRSAWQPRLLSKLLPCNTIGRWSIDPAYRMVYGAQYTVHGSTWSKIQLD